MDEQGEEESLSHSVIARRTAEDGVWGNEMCSNNTEGSREPATMKLVQKDGPQSNMLVPGKETRETLGSGVSPRRRMKRNVWGNGRQRQ